MKPLPIKHKIKAAIVTFLKMFKVGDVLMTDDVINYCHRHVTKYIRDESILRYLRELRQDGEINYNCKQKESRYIEIIEPGQAHSL